MRPPLCLIGVLVVLGDVCVGRIAHQGGPFDEVDVAAFVRIEADRPHREVVADGNVDPAARVVAFAAALRRADFEVDPARKAADVRFVGDVVEGSRLRARSEQRALGAWQQLDALDVDEAHVRLLRDRRHRLLVEVDRDLAVDPEFRGAGRNAADDDGALAGPGAVDVHGGQRAYQVVKIGQRLLLDEVRGERGDALGHDLQVDLAPRGRDDHFFERVALAVGGENRGCRIQRCGNRDGERRLEANERCASR